MRTLTSIILLLFASTVFGQSKIINIPTYKNYQNQVDTTLWFKWKSALAEKLELPNLQTSKDTFHFRFWTDIQVLDIWTFDNSTFFGLVTNYAQRYDPKLLKKGTHQVDTVFSNNIQLDSSIAKNIFQLLEKLNIVNIPSDDKIKGWQQGLDGTEYIIETSNKSQYDFKTYWTPSIFAKTTIEAKQIQTLVDKFYNDFKLYSYYEKLKLPKGMYKRDGVQGIKIRNLQDKNENKYSITDWF
ncbi:MAG: hypothetical protein ABIY62_00200 [Ginsengibacter sp.]